MTPRSTTLRPVAQLAGFALAVGLALVLSLVLSLALAVEARAGDGPVAREHLTIELVSETTTLRPGTRATLGLRFRLDPEWHIYWRYAGDSGLPPTVAWTLPKGFEAGPLEWPVPRPHVQGPIATYVYDDDVLLPVTLSVPADALPGEVTLIADVEWLVCKEDCLPGDARLQLRLPVRDVDPVRDPAVSRHFDAARRALPRNLESGRATATWDGRSTRLRVTHDHAWVGENVKFDVIPGEWNLLQGSAPQRVTREEGAVRIELAAPRDRTDPPERLHGLLIVTRGDERVGHAFDVPVARPPPGAVSPPREDMGAGSLLAALLLAVLGGLLLNLMPCVLPVLSIKVLSFVNQAGEDPRRIRRHGSAFGIGVLASFAAMAGLLLALRAGGEGLGWGFQLQEPWFVAALALLMFAVGLNLLGVFEIGGSVAGVAGRAADRFSGGYRGSFASGVLATVIATPCTAPFMGPALGYALSVPPAVALCVFLALGLGMAAPYVLLAWFPAWLKHLPRPGAWMVTFRQVMSFPIFATVIWLVWVFGQQVGTDGTAALLLACLGLGAAAWALTRFSGDGRGPRGRFVLGRALPVLLLSLGLAAGAWGVFHGRPPGALPEGYEPWTPTGVEQALAKGRPAFVDFTADWCVTCKFNELTVLATDEVKEAVAAHDVAMLRADWTRRDAEVTKALASFGRSSVPLYVVYSPVPGRAPEVLPTVITPGLVAEALRRAAPGAGSP